MRELTVKTRGEFFSSLRLFGEPSWHLRLQAAGFRVVMRNTGPGGVRTRAAGSKKPSWWRQLGVLGMEGLGRLAMATVQSVEVGIEDAAVGRELSSREAGHAVGELAVQSCELRLAAEQWRQFEFQAAFVEPCVRLGGRHPGTTPALPVLQLHRANASFSASICRSDFPCSTMSSSGDPGLAC